MWNPNAPEAGQITTGGGSSGGGKSTTGGPTFYRSETGPLARKYGLVPREPTAPGLVSFQDATTGGSIEMKEGFTEKQLADKVAAHRSMHEPTQVESRNPMLDRAAPGAHVKGADYTDEGLRQTFLIPPSTSLKDLESQGLIVQKRNGSWGVLENGPGMSTTAASKQAASTSRFTHEAAPVSGVVKVGLAESNLSHRLVTPGQQRTLETLMKGPNWRGMDPVDKRSAIERILNGQLF